MAAGRGERLGADRPKALVELAGRPLMQWSIEVLQRVAAIQRIVVALPPGVSAPAGIIGVPGGATRSESVLHALAAAGLGDPVLVHDAARPLVSVELAERVLAAAEADGVDGAIAAAAVTDTIKRADERGVVSETLDRSSLWAVQTPQVFRRAALERALRAPADVLAQATDDAWLIERSGGTVVTVESRAPNLKVTTSLDLLLAELLLTQ